MSTLRWLMFPGMFAFALLANAGEGQKPPPPPPPPPQYMPVGVPPPGDRMQPGRDGRQLFHAHCGHCHLAFGMGTNLLTAQRAAAGLPPETGLLENRTDLAADAVTRVVRHGKMAMPPLSRVEVTDAELDSIALYLSRTRP